MTSLYTERLQSEQVCRNRPSSHAHYTCACVHTSQLQEYD